MENYTPNEAYNPIWELEKVQPEERYKSTFNKTLDNHIKYLRNIINENIRFPGYYAISICLNAIQCLREAYKDDAEFDTAIDTLTKLYIKAQQNTYYLTFTQYGDALLNILDSKERIDLDTKITELKDKIREIDTSLLYNFDEYYKNLNVHLPDFLDYSSELIWCVAIKKPFNQDEFNTVCGLFNRYTIKCAVNGYFSSLNYTNELRNQGENNNLIQNIHVEQLLALIYAKNLIGGQNTVNQEKKRIDDWINESINFHETEQCFLLASGLSWMGLFELERDVLRQLVEKKINLPAELQDRLGFLENGGSVNIKIYDVDTSEDFLYDSSASDWNTDAYDLFFRKLEMTHKKLNYSLAVSKWTETFPLESGRKITQEQIGKSFLNFVKDFNGEIVVNKENAKAINLVNVEYKDSFIFRFKSERNRCVSILFSSEKFGRNLNITIITLFTPEHGLSAEDLKKYALAIKDNIYVKSFTTSILQEVNELTKFKQAVYDDELYAEPNKNSIFD